ncbi:hypothetical protein CAB17_02790 [Legionella sainthelensi]|uniref:Uncharacterized protein n=1 Tax=Legionella sainthelensi TaxID=28087 RepID=A0A2H5FHT0_9GAMM|nr:hypothetical protein CAB17_02790 [Legionella sainthelensi]
MVAVVIVSDLAAGTGRFNFLVGVLGLCVGVGSSIWGSEKGIKLINFMSHTNGKPRLLVTRIAEKHVSPIISQFLANLMCFSIVSMLRKEGQIF